MLRDYFLLHFLTSLSYSVIFDTLPSCLWRAGQTLGFPKLDPPKAKPYQRNWYRTVVGRAGVFRAVLNSDVLFNIKIISKPGAEQVSIPKESDF